MSVKKTRRGDTMIEVMFGVAIFGLIAITSIGLMNNGLATSEANLETTMARNEMNAQAEALRFVHSSYAATNGNTYKTVWQNITSKANSSSAPSFTDGADCNSFYNGGAASQSSFALNTETITDSPTTIITGNGLQLAETYPVFDNGTVYGIWINATKSSQTDGGKPYYYDFYIRSCWYGAGNNTATTLDTVVRLYNPDRGVSRS